MRNYSGEFTIMDAKESGGIGNSFYVKDYRHVVVTIASADNAEATLVAVGAITDDAPDFALSQSVDNCYEFIQMRDYQDNSPVNGDTGVTFSGNGCRMLEINTNGLTWLNFLAEISSGNVTVKAVGFNDS